MCIYIDGLIGLLALKCDHINYTCSSNLKNKRKKSVKYVVTTLRAAIFKLFYKYLNRASVAVITQRKRNKNQCYYCSLRFYSTGKWCIRLYQLKCWRRKKFKKKLQKRQPVNQRSYCLKRKTQVTKLIWCGRVLAVGCFNWFYCNIN